MWVYMIQDQVCLEWEVRDFVPFVCARVEFVFIEVLGMSGNGLCHAAVLKKENCKMNKVACYGNAPSGDPQVSYCRRWEPVRSLPV